jgi:hypothetical protein
MKRQHLFLLALAAAACTVQAADRSVPPLYSEGGEYTAVLQQSSGDWRLTPTHGQDLWIRADEAACGGANPVLPNGVWLLTHAAGGGIALLAPSVTALPPGHPETVPLHDCEAPAEPGPALRLPRPLLEWIAQSSGAVLLTD